MKVAVCQYGDGKSSDEMAITRSIHRAACDRYGYDYVVPQIAPAPDWHPYWQKAFLVQKVLKLDYDLVVWLDSDAIWLGEQPLEPPGIDLVGGTKHWHYDIAVDCFNCGVLYYNARHPRIHDLISDWIATPDDGHPWRDQAAFNKLIQTGRYTVSELGHEWNAVVDNPAYTSAKRPIVAAWHGIPDRVNRMSRWVQEEVFPRSPRDVLTSWGRRQQLRRIIELIDARIVVEVGVYRGEFLEQLAAANVRNCRFIGIDRWEMYVGYDGYTDELADSDLLVKARRIADRRFKSSPAVELIASESTDTQGLSAVDVVYIDANHLAEYVAKDIAAWWPVVKPGGVLAGHDYYGDMFPGVVQAVNDFVAANNLALYTTTGERFASWAVIKPN